MRPIRYARIWTPSRTSILDRLHDDARQDYTYTARNELASVTTTNASAPADGKTLSFTYYKTGQRETMQRPNEASPVRYYYDAMNRLAVLEDETNGGRFDFEYDGYGRRSKLSFPNGLTTYYEYTAAGAQESILTVDASGVPLQSWVYDYDSAGNPISKTDIDGQVERYGYDSRGRLVRTDYPDGTTTPANGIETPYARYDGYRYDPVGNRIEEWREHGTEGGELHVSASFDAANRLNLRTIDPPGAGADQDTETYRWMAQGALMDRTLAPAVGSAVVSSWTYDAADRLVSYTIPGEGSVSADYDTRGRRVGVSQTDTATATTTERRVVFDGLQEVSEYDGDSMADPSVPTRTQTTTRRLDEVIGSSLPPAGSGEDRPWRTHHGDIIQSGTLTADQSGGVDSRGRYRAYGDPLEGGGEPAWGFAGRPHEVGGMVPLRARSFAPGLGAFLSADPAFWPGQLQNDRSYGASSPVAFSDPTGRVSEIAAFGAAGIGALALGLLWAMKGAMCPDKAAHFVGGFGFALGVTATALAVIGGVSKSWHLAFQFAAAIAALALAIWLATHISDLLEMHRFNTGGFDPTDKAATDLGILAGAFVTLLLAYAVGGGPARLTSDFVLSGLGVGVVTGLLAFAIRPLPAARRGC